VADRPNILLIHTDQHRFDALGCSGNADISTPSIDRIAAHGVRYRRHFTVYPVCTPSRYSLLSGVYVRRHGGWTNHSTLQTHFPTFPRLLAASGYRTAAVGKMHFTPTYLDVGFQEMRLAEQHGPGRHDDDYHRDLRAHGLIDRLDLVDQVLEFRRNAPEEYWKRFGAMATDLPEEHHSTRWIGDRAVEMLSEWRGHGHLLMVGFIKPHHPFDPPQRLAGLYDPERIALTSGWREAVDSKDLALSAGYFPHESLSEAALRRVIAYYYASITHIDEQVGRMIDCLEQRGLYGQTLVVVTSDHGEHLGYRHLLLKGGYLYDSLARIPLIVKYPDSCREPRPDAGGFDDSLASNIDVAPTLLRRAGLEAPPEMNGRDLLAQEADRGVVFAEAERGEQYMVRTGRRKLLVRRDQGTCRLFDLEEDPLELHDVYDDPAYRRDREELRQRLFEWALFESRGGPYLDEDAPVIDRPNVPKDREAQRAASRAYFQP